MYKVNITRNIGIQVGTPISSLKSQGTQSGEEISSSYQRHSDSPNQHITYDELQEKFLVNKQTLIEWLKQIGLLAKQVFCPQCKEIMHLTHCDDRSDGFKYECRSKTVKRHRVEVSIRKNTWFEQSNMTLEEILKFTYWWTVGLKENQIITQLRLSANTAVDWSMFCREVCEVLIAKQSQRIGGERIRVQIDESKIGKRKYHKGHFVEGQWVFGGIEEDTRKAFLVPVEDRSEKTLISIIQKWIEPGSIIISDCWKGYFNLNKYGYIHETVNHSKEFVNEEGSHTNKIEGHWRQMKSSLPTHGRRKYHYSSYLAEFMWKYSHKGDDLFWAFLEAIKTVYNPQI
jgi:transposase-like protein